MGDENKILDLEEVKSDDQPLTLLVEKTFKIEDGLHNGKITRIERRETKQGYKYIDFYVSVDEMKREDNSLIELKFGFPEYLTETSSLGKFLIKMGVPVIAGKMIDIKGLIGMKVQYQTMTETDKDNNQYARILNQTVKPYNQ